MSVYCPIHHDWPPSKTPLTYARGHSKFPTASERKKVRRKNWKLHWWLVDYDGDESWSSLRGRRWIGWTKRFSTSLSLSVCQSGQSVGLSLSVPLSVCLSVPLSVYLIYLSVCPSICLQSDSPLCVSLSVCLSVCVSLRPSVCCLSVCLSVYRMPQIEMFGKGKKVDDSWLSFTLLYLLNYWIIMSHNVTMSHNAIAVKSFYVHLIFSFTWFPMHLLHEGGGFSVRRCKDCTPTSLIFNLDNKKG